MAAVGEQQVEIGGEGCREGDVLAQGAAQQALHVGDDRVEIERLGPDGFLAAEGQKLAGELARAPAGPADLLDVLQRRRVRRHLLGRERGVVDHHAKQVVEVVRDAAGELPQALQTLGLLALSLKPLECGEILKLAKQPVRLRCAEAQHRGVQRDLDRGARRSDHPQLAHELAALAGRYRAQRF